MSERTAPESPGTGPHETLPPQAPEGEEERIPEPPRDARHAWTRLLRAASLRPGRSSIVVAALAGALGFAVVAQVHQTSTEGLETLREDELVRVFADVDRDGEQLASEIRELQTSLDLLKSQSTNEEAAQKAAQSRVDTLGILTGTVPATGPGITVLIRDPEGKVDSSVILDTVQELRDAGAEAIQVGDARVVAQTWFADTDSGISVSGTEVGRPILIKAIGDANTLAGAMEIPGGVTATVRRAGGEATVEIQDEVKVTALLTVTPPQYAQPVPTSTP